MAQKHAAFAQVTVAAASVKASYVLSGTLLALSQGNYMGCIILNSLDQPVKISLDGGTTDFAELAAAEPLFFNAYAMNRLIKKGNVTAYYTGSAPASGSLRMTFVA